MASKVNQRTVIVIVIAIIVILILLANRRKSVLPVVPPLPPVPPTPSTSSSGYGDILNLQNASMPTDFDLSGQKSLQVVNVQDCYLNALILARVTNTPTSISVTDTTFYSPFTNVTDDFYALNLDNITGDVDWATIFDQIVNNQHLLSLYLAGLNWDQPAIPLGNITFAEPFLNSYQLLYFTFCNVMSSIGNITAPASYGVPNEPIYINIQNSTRLTSIGDITLSLTEPDAFVNLEIVLNADLTSIGDITLSTFSYIIISSNPLLTTLGTLTFGQWTVDPYNYPIYLGFNAFDTAAISKIFTDLDATGITNSTVVVQGNPGSAGPFTVPGQAAYLSLQGKGWTIIV